VASFNEQLVALGSMFDVILQDGGKIQALGQDLGSNNPQWSWNLSTPGLLLDAIIEPTEKLSYYQSLMATVYAVREMVLYAVTGCEFC